MFEKEVNQFPHLYRHAVIPRVYRHMFHLNLYHHAAICEVMHLMVSLVWTDKQPSDFRKNRGNKNFSSFQKL